MTPLPIYLLALVGRSSERRIVKSMRLDVEDLPDSGWRVFSERTFRTGAWGTTRSPEAGRAYRLGLFSSVISYEQTPGHSAVGVTLRQYADESDAIRRLPHVREMWGRNPNSRVTVAEERVVNDIQIEGVTHTLVIEQETIGLDYPTVTRIVAGVVGRVLFNIKCSGLLDTWPWEKVIALASLQASKIRDTLLTLEA